MRDYFELTKPRMVMANLIVAAAVFVFASHGSIVWQTFALLVFGLMFTVAGGCTLNNIYDRDLDAKMPRTKNRAMAARRLDTNRAILFGSALVALGIRLLWAINTPTLVAGLAGALIYVFAYTPLKHKSGWALYVGAIAGAMPAVAGYTAAAGAMDLVAWLLFAFMFLWQIPHFMTIARFRYDEYTTAGVPLAVARPANEQARSHARRLFFSSLVFLLIACAMLATAGLFA